MQARLDLVALEAGVACFGARAPTHAVALLDVVGAEAALASADDATQEELLAGRAQFLNAQTAASPEGVSTSVMRRLQARSDLVARQLGRSGLRTRRLDSRQVAEVLHRCWSPELARVQRLRDELGAYTTLVVSSRRFARPK